MYTYTVYGVHNDDINHDIKTRYDGNFLKVRSFGKHVTWGVVYSNNNLMTILYDNTVNQVTYRADLDQIWTFAVMPCCLYHDINAITL